MSYSGINNNNICYEITGFVFTSIVVSGYLHVWYGFNYQNDCVYFTILKVIDWRRQYTIYYIQAVLLYEPYYFWRMIRIISFRDDNLIKRTVFYGRRKIKIPENNSPRLPLNKRVKWTMIDNIIHIRLVRSIIRHI